MSVSAENYLLYDGQCNLCSRAVTFVHRRDKRKNIRVIDQFSTEGAGVMAANQFLPTGDTIVFCKGAKCYERSSAIIEILTTLGGLWSLFSIAKIVPIGVRDAVYNLVARNRYKWFGTACSIKAKV